MIEEERYWDNLEKVEEDSYQIDSYHRRFEEVVEMVVVGSLVVDSGCRTVRIVAADRRMGSFVERRWVEDSLVGLEVEDRSRREAGSRVVDIRLVEDRSC